MHHVSTWIALALTAAVPAGADGCLTRPKSSAALRSNYNYTMTVDGRERRYILHVPPQLAPPAAGWPLVIVLHGTHGTGQKVQRDLGFDTHADTVGFITAYPDAYQRMRWNDGRGTLPSSAAGIDDVAFLVALVSDIAQRVPVNLDRVYLTGVSNGGMMTYRAGCEAPHVFAAIAPALANVPEPIFATCAPPAGLSVLAINGAADPAIPLGGGEVCSDFEVGCEGGFVVSIDQSLGRFAAANGCDGTYTSVLLPQSVNDGTTVERRTYTACPAGVEVLAYIIHGAGHVWPPRPPQLPALGPTSANLDATGLVVEFFLRHERAGGG